MKHECAGKVGGGGDHSGQVEVGTRRKQADLPIAQKVRFDRSCAYLSRAKEEAAKELEATQNLPVQCRVRRGLCRKGADNENLSKSGWLILELGTRQ